MSRAEFEAPEGGIAFAAEGEAAVDVGGEDDDVVAECFEAEGAGEDAGDLAAVVAHGAFVVQVVAAVVGEALDERAGFNGPVR